MASRLNLQKELEELLGTRNVYFQPPASIKMSYPCIRYTLYDIVNSSADDFAYNQNKSYQLTYISTRPDDEAVDKLSQLKYCNFNRYYAADNLHHYVFTIYY